LLSLCFAVDEIQIFQLHKQTLLAIFQRVFRCFFFPAYVSEALRADKNEMKKNYLASGRTGLAGHNYEL